jgi:BirA family biotin operon repressor/biotin-[acetyl-CoA-carboxylase] ligase
MERGLKMSDEPFTDDDLDHILRSTFVEQIEFHSVIASTNERAMELAQNSTSAGPVLILAAAQTRGRGRGTNRWWAAPGALTFTLLLETGLPQRSLPQVSLTVGLAVCEAVQGFLQAPDIRLKWPNDVYCLKRKLSGILIELPKTDPQRLAIGVGININNSSRQSPEDLRHSAIAMCDVTADELSLSDVLVSVLNRIEHRLECIGLNDEELRVSWRQRCLLTNRTVQLDQGARKILGRCRGIDDDGALIIETDTGTERCFAGTVNRF